MVVKLEFSGQIGYVMRNYFTSLSSVDTTILSDEDLVRGINASNDPKLKEEFFRRYEKVIAKAVNYACSKTKYGLSFDEDAMSEAKSEACLAVERSLRLYDFKSASLKTYITNKIMFHFMDLKRNAKTHTDREKPLSSYEQYGDCDDDSYSSGTDYIEYSVARDCFEADEHNKEMRNACSRLFAEVGNKRHQECLCAYYEALSNDVEKPVEYVAEKIGCSRQQVYNILKQVRKALPVNLAAEIRAGF